MAEVLGIARFKFHSGQVEEYKRLSAEIMDIVHTKDTGTLQYDIYFNADESEGIVLERYSDSDALIEHTTNIGHIIGPIMATASVTGELFGEPNDKLRAMLADSPIGVFTLFQSM